jgi:hypothetical protein
MRNAYKILDEKIPLGRSRLKWDDNIKMDVGIVCLDVDWIRVAGSFERGNKPWGSMKGGALSPI